MSKPAFDKDLGSSLGSAGVALTTPQRKALLTALSERDGDAEIITLAGLVDRYLGAQESNSIYTARIHANHLKKTFGDSFDVQSLTTAHLQAHVDRRACAKGRHGKPLSPVTIKKEIASFSSIWSWAGRMSHVTGAFPSRGLVYPKTSEKPPFQTRAEIEE